MRIAINQESVAAIRNLAVAAQNASSDLQDATIALFREYRGAASGLGIYGEPIEEILSLMVDVQSEISDSLLALFPLLQKIADDMELFLSDANGDSTSINSIFSNSTTFIPINDQNQQPSSEEKNGKVLRLSEKQLRENGQSYIKHILDIYKENLIGRGANSVVGISNVLENLRVFYSNELEKEIQRIPNRLYEDPDYEKLLNEIENTRPSIAGVFPDKNMSFEEADSGSVNPDYWKSEGYMLNCQSCVVVFEARQRGYNVKVLPNISGSTLDRLSRNTNLAWIDPKTGKHPDYIYDEHRKTPEDYFDFINATVKTGERYTLQFIWKKRGHTGHIISLDRTQNGMLRLKDNQPDDSYKNTWIGDVEIIDYLYRMKYEEVLLTGEKVPCVPKMIRVDNMDFDYDIVNDIMVEV